MVTLVDSHCHLNFPQLLPNIDQVIKDANSKDVKYLQTICTKLSEFDQVQQIALKYSNVWCSMGIHPCNVLEHDGVDLKQLALLASRDKVIGLGETGLDYYYAKDSAKQQQHLFAMHLELSATTNQPVIIHSRDAEADTLAMLREAESSYGNLRALLHCFTGSKQFAYKALDMGVNISFSGIITFKNALELQETAASLPLDMMMVETDAPYLAPIPYRGKDNQPAYTWYTANKLAELKSISLEQLAEATTANFFRLFDKAIK
ncbi:MAG: TatD family hydrolase [Pseudomonadota bacterium]